MKKGQDKTSARPDAGYTFWGYSLLLCAGYGLAMGLIALLTHYFQWRWPRAAGSGLLALGAFWLLLAFILPKRKQQS